MLFFIYFICVICSLFILFLLCVVVGRLVSCSSGCGWWWSVFGSLVAGCGCSAYSGRGRDWFVVPFMFGCEF